MPGALERRATAGMQETLVTRAARAMSETRETRATAQTLVTLAASVTRVLHGTLTTRATVATGATRRMSAIPRTLAIRGTAGTRATVETQPTSEIRATEKRAATRESGNVASNLHIRLELPVPRRGTLASLVTREILETDAMLETPALRVTLETTSAVFGTTSSSRREQVGTLAPTAHRAEPTLVTSAPAATGTAARTRRSLARLKTTAEPKCATRRTTGEAVIGIAAGRTVRSETPTSVRSLSSRLVAMQRSSVKSPRRTRRVGTATPTGSPPLRPRFRPVPLTTRGTRGGACRTAR